MSYQFSLVMSLKSDRTIIHQCKLFFVIKLTSTSLQNFVDWVTQSKSVPLFDNTDAYCLKITVSIISSPVNEAACHRYKSFNSDFIPMTKKGSYPKSDNFDDAENY
ncbi:hypothetical protein BpHYR1_001077 [Brachionus plicatilis]|uniref:Uncharacterized protein n=1 Tax=Brachionus plicatilis TaxID=10195 RepID=A0A3M7S6D9_BRAPC|nr:hypothetical protein BpHYR1_001077 [Brachionus plicatilis]